MTVLDAASWHADQWSCLVWNLCHVLVTYVRGILFIYLFVFHEMWGHQNRCICVMPPQNEMRVEGINSKIQAAKNKKINKKWKQDFVWHKQVLKLIVLSAVIDCRNTDGPSNTSILKTAISTTNNSVDSWKTRSKWREILRLPINITWKSSLIWIQAYKTNRASPITQKSLLIGIKLKMTTIHASPNQL